MRRRWPAATRSARRRRPAAEPPGPAFFQSFLEKRLPGVEVEIAYPTYNSPASSAPTATTSTRTRG